MYVHIHVYIYIYIYIYTHTHTHTHTHHTKAHVVGNINTFKLVSQRRLVRSTSRGAVYRPRNTLGPH